MRFRRGDMDEKEKAARNTNGCLLLVMAPIIIILVLWAMSQMGLFGK